MRRKVPPLSRGVVRTIIEERGDDELEGAEQVGPADSALTGPGEAQDNGAGDSGAETARPTEPAQGDVLPVTEGGPVVLSGLRLGPAPQRPSPHLSWSAGDPPDPYLQYFPPAQPAGIWPPAPLPTKGNRPPLAAILGGVAIMIVVAVVSVISTVQHLSGGGSSVPLAMHDGKKWFEDPADGITFAVPVRLRPVAVTKDQIRRWAEAADQAFHDSQSSEEEQAQRLQLWFFWASAPADSVQQVDVMRGERVPGLEEPITVALARGVKQRMLQQGSQDVETSLVTISGAPALKVTWRKDLVRNDGGTVTQYYSQYIFAGHSGSGGLSVLFLTGQPGDPYGEQRIVIDSIKLL